MRSRPTEKVESQSLTIATMYQIFTTQHFCVELQITGHITGAVSPTMVADLTAAETLAAS